MVVATTIMYPLSDYEALPGKHTGGGNEKIMRSDHGTLLLKARPELRVHAGPIQVEGDTRQNLQEALDKTLPIVPAPASRGALPTVQEFRSRHRRDAHRFVTIRLQQPFQIELAALRRNDHG